jgi:hypothetical protein
MEEIGVCQNGFIMFWDHKDRHKSTENIFWDEMNSLKWNPILTKEAYLQQKLHEMSRVMTKPT